MISKLAGHSAVSVVEEEKDLVARLKDLAGRGLDAPRISSIEQHLCLVII
jgi:hypothetical protein